LILKINKLFWVLTPVTWLTRSLLFSFLNSGCPPIFTRAVKSKVYQDILDILELLEASWMAWRITSLYSISFSAALFVVVVVHSDDDVMKCIKCNNWYSSLFKDYSFIIICCSAANCEILMLFCCFLFCSVLFSFSSILKFSVLLSNFSSSYFLFFFFSIFSLYFLSSFFFLFLKFFLKPITFRFLTFEFSAVDKVSIDVEFSEDRKRYSCSGDSKLDVCCDI